jgi:hypothetical protein
LTNLAGSLSALLTRLKYYLDLTSYVEEAAYYLSRITDRIKEMVQLDKEIEQATRERDAAMRRYAVANEQMVARYVHVQIVILGFICFFFNGWQYFLLLLASLFKGGIAYD